MLGGQNLFAFYNDQMSKLPNDLMTAYDGQLNTAFLSAAKLYATGEGWLYGAVVKDLCTKQIVGYAFSDRIDTCLLYTSRYSNRHRYRTELVQQLGE